VLEYQLDGRPSVTLNAGDVGSGNAAELATYIVEKGKPLSALAQ
jgi:hypothetical protein